MSEHILVEALFAQNCGSRKSTLLLIDKVAQNRSLIIELKEMTVDSTQDAQLMKFLGSPSIRVNGYDIEQEAIQKTDYGIG